MRSELSQLVHPILRYGLELKARLARGEPVVLENEQTALKAMLLTDADARRVPDFGGDPGFPESRGGDSASGEERASSPARASADRFLGVRYALVCWLDELFIIDSPWETPWNERKLEVALYGTNDRAWRFWEQAKWSEARTTADVPEAFFLCVMLGFRGALRTEPERLENWVRATRGRISALTPKTWDRPAERELLPAVPPLRARGRLDRVLFQVGTAVLLLLPLVAFVLFSRLGR